MARKNAKKKSAAAPGTFPESPAGASAAAREGGEASGSSLLWLISIILVVSGYAMLHKVDPGGRNGWAAASPAFLLAGYLLMIPAIMRTYRARR